MARVWFYHPCLPGSPSFGWTGNENGRFPGTGENQKIALFAGSLSHRGQEEREMGFRHILSQEFGKSVNILMNAVCDSHYDPHPPRLQVIFRENIPEV